MRRLKYNILGSLLSVALSATALPVVGQSEEEVNRIIRGLAPISGQVSADIPQSTPDLGNLLTATQPMDINVIDVVVEQKIIQINLSYALDFNIYFEFDSAEFIPTAYADLKALGSALASQELRNYSYLIAGHTDSVGSSTYNQRLSELRANAVRRYLLESFPISPERLIPVGFGEDRLKYPNQPLAALNRRVEVAMIAGS
jgi:outer membrane protein OmpA-like peptidoglycan-associated protein